MYRSSNVRAIAATWSGTRHLPTWLRSLWGSTARSVRGLRGQAGGPPLLDPAELPHRKGDQPGHHEQCDDPVTGIVQRDRRDRGQRAGLDLGLVDQRTDQPDSRSARI
jgi:hypothetical protein